MTHNKYVLLYKCNVSVKKDTKKTIKIRFNVRRMRYVH